MEYLVIENYFDERKESFLLEIRNVRGFVLTLAFTLTGTLSCPGLRASRVTKSNIYLYLTMSENEEYFDGKLHFHRKNPQFVAWLRPSRSSQNKEGGLKNSNNFSKILKMK